MQIDVSSIREVSGKEIIPKFIPNSRMLEQRNTRNYFKKYGRNKIIAAPTVTDITEVMKDTSMEVTITKVNTTEERSRM